jgi:hypothetical protein
MKLTEYEKENIAIYCHGLRVSPLYYCKADAEFVIQQLRRNNDEFKGMKLEIKKVNLL